MSSMRNAVSRRPHKERSQPQNRQKWGILEKHKDYSLRAQDYNTKKRKLAVLSQKSRDRHPDEFAFGMLSAGSASQGKHTGKKEHENRLGHDAVKLLKTQDAGYLRTVAAQTRRELDRVDQEVRLNSIMKHQKTDTQVGGSGQKIVFDDNGESPVKGRKQKDTNVLEEIEDNLANGHVMSETTEGPRLSDDERTVAKSKSGKSLRREKDALARLKLERKRRKRLQEMRAAKLEILKKRQRDVQAVADQLELQRAKMAKAVGGTNKDGIKFKIRERKK